MREKAHLCPYIKRYNGFLNGRPKIEYYFTHYCVGMSGYLYHAEKDHFKYDPVIIENSDGTIDAIIDDDMHKVKLLKKFGLNPVSVYEGVESNRIYGISKKGVFYDKVYHG